MAQTVTKKKILQKVNRKRNPVQNMAELAREFDYNTNIWRWNIGRDRGTAAPGSFRKKVKSLVGERTYNRIRDDRFVNRTYR